MVSFKELSKFVLQIRCRTVPVICFLEFGALLDPVLLYRARQKKEKGTEVSETITRLKAV